MRKEKERLPEHIYDEERGPCVRCAICGEYVPIGETLGKHKDQHVLDSRLSLPQTCPLCNNKTEILDKYEAFCSVCFAYFPLSPLIFNEEIEKIEKRRSSPLRHICFFCHRTISNGVEYETRATTQQKIEFWTHQECRDAVANPFFREMEKHNEKNGWTDADHEAYDAEETRFLNLVLMLNRHDPIRKIAEQIKIDRNKVWRVAQNIKQLQQQKP
jgi:hypothetical protein